MGYISVGDLDPFACIDVVKALAMIDDAEALAVAAAPCLADASKLTDAQKAAVKAVLRAAILRWNEGGTGAVTTQSAGPFSQTQDTRQQRRALFWPSEIEQLQEICNAVTGGAGGAFTIDTAPCVSTVHADVCSINFGATYCSCGAIFAGYPLYENT